MVVLYKKKNKGSLDNYRPINYFIIREIVWNNSTETTRLCDKTRINQCGFSKIGTQTFSSVGQMTSEGLVHGPGPLWGWHAGTDVTHLDQALCTWIRAHVIPIDPIPHQSSPASPDWVLHHSSLAHLISLNNSTGPGMWTHILWKKMLALKSIRVWV